MTAFRFLLCLLLAASASASAQLEVSRVATTGSVNVMNGNIHVETFFPQHDLIVFSYPVSVDLPVFMQDTVVRGYAGVSVASYSMIFGDATFRQTADVNNSASGSMFGINAEVPFFNSESAQFYGLFGLGLVSYSGQLAYPSSGSTRDYSFSSTDLNLGIGSRIVINERLWLVGSASTPYLLRFDANLSDMSPGDVIANDPNDFWQFSIGAQYKF